MMESSDMGRKKDTPPDYVSVIKMKNKEDEELPTYSEAIIMEEGKGNIECAISHWKGQ